VPDATSSHGPVPLVVAAIGASELVLVFMNLAIGVLLHAVVLAAILVRQAQVAGRSDRRSIVPLALVPLLRLLSLTMPLPGIPPMYWVALVGTPLAVAGGLAARASELTPADIGLTQRPWAPQLVIALCGIPAGIAIWRFADPASLVQPADGFLSMALLLVVFVAFVEEFIFRGVILAGLRTTYRGSAVLISAALYATTYFGSLSPSVVISMGAVGLLYGFMAERSGSIVGVAISHAFLVVGSFLVWPSVLGPG
jgi:membrane protease YdiL (CAAX protease family)